MALSIKNDEADRLARELAERTGESLTQAVVVSLRERLERKKAEDGQDRAAALVAWVEELNRFPVTDPRSPDEILGYDENGLPT